MRQKMSINTITMEIFISVISMPLKAVTQGDFARGNGTFLSEVSIRSLSLEKRFSCKHFPVM